jgi:hypothetical protein
MFVIVFVCEVFSDVSPTVKIARCRVQCLKQVGNLSFSNYFIF